MTGVGDGKQDNFNLNFNGDNYSKTEYDTFEDALKGQYGYGYSDYYLSYGDGFFDYTPLEFVFSWDYTSDTGDINGTYVWYNNNTEGRPDGLWFKLKN